MVLRFLLELLESRDHLDRERYCFALIRELRSFMTKVPSLKVCPRVIFQIIRVLLQCGAHLHGDAVLIGEKMCMAATIGNTKRLQSYLLAGADLSQKNFSGRTPLHFAALHDRTEAIEFLLDHGADPRCVDKLGETAADLAEAARAAGAIRLLAPFKQNGIHDSEVDGKIAARIQNLGLSMS